MTAILESLDDIEYDDDDVDAKIDRYHAGWDMHIAGKPCPSDPDMAAGWKERSRAVQVRVVMPRRPEGYYHMPLGAFD